MLEQVNVLPLGFGALSMRFASVDMDGTFMEDESGAQAAVPEMHALCLVGGAASRLGVSIHVPDEPALVYEQSSARQHLMFPLISLERQSYELVLLDERLTAEHLQYRESCIRQSGLVAPGAPGWQRDRELREELCKSLPVAEAVIVTFDTEEHLMSTYAALECVKMDVFGLTTADPRDAAYQRGRALSNKPSKADAAKVWSPFGVATVSSVLSLFE